MNQIPEKDWKQMRKLKDVLLETFCDDVITELKKTIESHTGRSHEAYLEMWKRIHQEDETLSLMFDDFKRSTAILKLAMWRKNGLLKDQDFSSFSEDTKSKVVSLIDL